MIISVSTSLRSDCFFESGLAANSPGRTGRRSCRIVLPFVFIQVLLMVLIVLNYFFDSFAHKDPVFFQKLVIVQIFFILMV